MRIRLSHSHRHARAVQLVGLTLAMAALPAAAWASPLGGVVEYPVSSFNAVTSIAAGPDGNLWFTNRVDDAIGRMTPSGSIDAFPAGSRPGSVPERIVAGADGTIWFTEADADLYDGYDGDGIARITPQGDVTELPLDIAPTRIAAGSDGNLWLSEGGQRIGRLTPAGVLTWFTSGITSAVGDVTAGPDGNVWFTTGTGVGRITPAGAVTETPITGQGGAFPYRITAGAGDDVWFTMANANRIGRMTTAGTVTWVDQGALALTTGADAALWLPSIEVGVLRRTPDGTLTPFAEGFTTVPFDLAPGPDGDVWFAGGDVVGRIGTGAAAAVAQAPGMLGTAQQDTVQECGDPAWNAWGGHLPERVGTRWLLDGTPLAGATGRLYTPVAGDRGHALSCEVTGRYAPLGVWASATSAPATVLAPPNPDDVHATLTAAPAAPEVGDTLRFTTTLTRGTPGFTYAYEVDGAAAGTFASAERTNSLDVPLTRAGTLRAAVTARDHDGGGPPSRAPLDVTVDERLTPRFTTSPADPGTGVETTFDASTTTGGRPPLRYSWDFDGDGTFDVTDASPAAAHTFAHAGTFTTHLRVVDAAGRVREATRPFTTCLKRVAFGLVEATTGGCFTGAGTAKEPRYETGSAIKLNGIALPAPPGKTKLALSAPTAEDPGGRLSVADTRIKLGALTVYEGDIDWRLPAGEQGDEKQVTTLSVPSGQKLFGLRVGGSVGLRLGWRKDGSHDAEFPLNIELPELFKSGPDKQAGAITGSAAVLVNASGPHFDGMRLQVANAWIGKLQVEQVCFSFVPAGGTGVEPCPTPELDGEPYLTCNENTTTDRWDGAAVLVLPTASKTRLAMWGGVAGSRLSKLGGFADELGTTVPIAPGVYLNRIGIGVCVYPPPFKIRGDVGVSYRFPAAGASAAQDRYTGPTAAFTFKPRHPQSGQPVTFDAAASTDPDGSVVRYAWDFDGDGTPDAIGNQPTASKAFATSGPHDVKLTVTDDSGKTDDTLRTVMVAASAAEQQRLDAERQQRRDRRPAKRAGRAVVTVNGYFLYTDAYEGSPWSLQLGGNLQIFDDDVGSGSLTIRPAGSIDFDFAAHFDIAGVASLSGELSGWIEAAVDRFNVDGTIRACLGKLCATSVTVVSSVGLSSCLDLGHITYWVPVKRPGWAWYRPWLVRWVERSLRLEAGFGYRWSGGLRLFGGSCDFAAYRAQRTPAQAAQDGPGFDVARGTPALTLRVLGGAGPPRFTLHGPDGDAVESPSSGSATEPGRVTIVENPSDGSTGVVLVAPKAGHWTITPAAGSTITRVETAAYEPPAQVTGAVRRTGAGFTAAVAYVLPAKATLSLVERGRSVERTIARTVHGRPCPGAAPRPDGGRLLCARVRFASVAGPGRARRLLGVVTRDGLPLRTLTIARWQAPRYDRPSAPRVTVLRRNGSLEVRWTRSANAARYSLTAQFGDGRKLGFDLGGRCRARRIASVPRSVRALVGVAGVRADLQTGRYTRVTLRAGRARAGAPSPAQAAMCR